MRKAKRAGETFLNILYPRRCPVCHDIAVPRGQKICTRCRDKLIPVRGSRCCLCSKPLGTSDEEYCSDCRRIKHHFKRGIGIFPYTSVIQTSLYQLKYGQRQEYGLFYGEIAALYAKKEIQQWKIQLLVPVPLHRKRQEKRGYNQAEILAEALGKCLGIPVDAQSLYRKKNTKPQKELDPSERRNNMKDAFSIRRKGAQRISGKNLLLVDDIYTTGTTLDAAAQCLKKAGAGEVFFLTIAVGSDPQAGTPDR